MKLFLEKRLYIVIHVALCVYFYTEGMTLLSAVGFSLSSLILMFLSVVEVRYAGLKLTKEIINLAITIGLISPFLYLGTFGMYGVIAEPNGDEDIFYAAFVTLVKPFTENGILFIATFQITARFVMSVIIDRAKKQ